ncbi:MAG: cupin domain-containing protein [Deltaproteobacteria bacterium]|nr:cupin domain-containing protein [Deltaproteobacteria bacterium]
MGNIFSSLPDKLEHELFEELLSYENIKIERIVSQGHTSLENGLYDQKENEWVIVLEGSGSILFERGNEINLKKGDYLNIPAHTKHKVTWTDPNNITIWLAIHYF